MDEYEIILKDGLWKVSDIDGINLKHSYDKHINALHVILAELVVNKHPRARLWEHEFSFWLDMLQHQQTLHRKGLADPDIQKKTAEWIATIQKCFRH